MAHSLTTHIDFLPTKQNIRQHRKPTIWTREKIYKLIELYRASDCLWNHYSESYKNKDCRNKAIDRICETLEISKIEYGKKVHNLRNQFNSELKKYERRLEKSEGKKALSPKTCRWEHFETLMFLRPIIEPRPGYQPQTKKLENIHKFSFSNEKSQIEDIIQLQILSVGDVSYSNAKEQGTCRNKETQSDSSNETCRTSPILLPSGKQNDVATSAPAPSNVRDQWDAFGELIANEFRNLNSTVSRKKLKRKIMQVMLEVGEEDDKNYASTN